jgi:H+/Cl- antiporter ClcA
VVQTPITSFVIVSEMTENHGLIIPLMLAALIADATSKMVCPGSVYHSLAEIAIERAGGGSAHKEAPAEMNE